MIPLMTEHDPTRKLVERAREGDREAFDTLAEEFLGRLRASVRGWTRFQLGPRLDIEDVLQDTLVRAYHALGRFEWQDEDAFFRWLCGIAKRALAQAAQEARKGEVRAAHTRRNEDAPAPIQVLRRQERLDRLEAALMELNPEYREVIRLCRIEGLTSTEVATRTQRSPAAVRQLLVRALRELKKRFGDTESFHLPHGGLQFGGKDHGE